VRGTLSICRCNTVVTVCYAHISNTFTKTLVLNIDVQDLNSNFTVYDTIDNWLDWLSEVLLLHINLSDLSNVKRCTDH